VKPGRHGIYRFSEIDEDDYTITPVNYNRMTRPAIWDIFNEFDMNIGMINYPAASPPRPIDPFFISGFPSSMDDTVAYPSSVQSYLESINYQIKPYRNPNDGAEPYLQEVKRMTTTRCETTIELLQQHEVDLLWTVFMGIDWIQHYLWNEKVNGKDAVDSIYEHIDALIGEILEEIDEDWNVIIVSDHGFQELNGEVHLNELLEQFGYLSRTGSDDLETRVSESIWESKDKLPTGSKHWIKRTIPERFIDQVKRAAGAGANNIDAWIDWQRTQVFTHASMGQIFVHTDRYAAGGVVETQRRDIEAEIIERLEGLSDPVTGDRIIEEVKRGEDIYGTDSTARTPDLLAIPEDWRYALYSDFGSPWVCEPRERVADHHPRGIFVFSDDGDTRNADEIGNELPCSNITPLLLTLHDLPVFDDMERDGIESMKHPSNDVIDPNEIEVGLPGKPMTKTDEQVKENLKDLGYM
jgi:predicted AlkP superfamily phosphohydrolase/phosphomutase